VNLFQFFNKESTAPKVTIIIMTLISGIANGLLLVIINQAVQRVVNREIEKYYFFVYVLGLVLFVATKRYAIWQTGMAIEEIILQIRIRIVDKLRRSELRFIETLDKSKVYTLLTQDTAQISQTVILLMNSWQASITLVAGMVYIALLSLFAFCITIVSVIIAVMIYLSKMKTMSGYVNELTIKQINFFTILNNFLEGFKEIKINKRKNDDLFKHEKGIAHEINGLNIASGSIGVMLIMFSQTFFYVLLGTIVFIVPTLSPTHAEIVIQLTVAILFIVSPVEAMANALPAYTRVNVAIAHLVRLETMLDKAAQRRDIYGQARPLQSFSPFKSIQLNQVTFHYVDADGQPTFSVGPINLSVRQGEMLFIMGGNGSGKSTLLKLLTGLYYPNGGTVWVDDARLSQPLYPSYRELFSTIFSDFHLFDRLYGLDNVDETEVNRMLRDMGLKAKTEFTGGRFSHLDLSTGQRKRLAFITTLLDDKPVYVFDELAADQDPTFRRYFYEVILRDMQKQGKTIVAATHDDRYFGVANRVVKMEDGQLIEDA
jgi:putative ATP-binding cassette transporter